MRKGEETMNKITLQILKGTRDFLPSHYILRKRVIEIIARTFESFGFEPMETPAMEYAETLEGKYGEDGDSLIYKFEDRGGRKVTLRPEMTPTVSRMVAARRQELAYPLRLFSIPNVWRYERPQRGRLREHWQLNVDLFGVSVPHNAE